MRYEMTARENVAVGRIEDLHDTERISDAARKSLADEVIAKLPGGYEQMLGTAIPRMAWIFPAVSGRGSRWRVLTCEMRKF